MLESLAPGRDRLSSSGWIDTSAVAADGRRMVSVSLNRTLRIRERGGCERSIPDCHDGRVTACAVTADGRRAISASADRTLRVWDLELARSLATLWGHEGPVLACALTADGR